MGPVTGNIYFGTLLLFTIVSPSLVGAETTPDFGVTNPFIDDEKPTLLSQALYVALPKDSRGEYQTPMIQTQPRRSETDSSMSLLIEQRIREIFSIRTDPKPVASNIDDDRHVFKVQRNPDGKLTVVFNNTQITPHYGADSDSDTDDISPHHNNNHNRHSPNIRDIVFPTEKPATHSTIIHPKCSENHKNFCTEVENYPADLLGSIIAAEPRKYEQLFGEDMLPPHSINLTQRIDIPGDEVLCISSERIVYPKAGLNKDDIWTIIVNHDNFTQGIRVEECKNSGAPCQYTDSFPLGYKTECQQKYAYRQLLSLNGQGQVVKDFFKMPSCCKCVISSERRFRRGSFAQKKLNQA